MKSVNPFNLEILEEFKETTAAELEKTLSHADKAFQTWKKASFKDRAALFQKLSTVIKTRSDSLAK